MPTEKAREDSCIAAENQVQASFNLIPTLHAADALVHACYQPCLCLWRGSALQITRNTPFRRTILQFRHIFLIDALTFIFDSH